MGIVNTCLSTIQGLFLGVSLEIYREHIFVSIFELISLALRWVTSLMLSSVFDRGDNEQIMPLGGERGPRKQEQAY
jgi:sugar (pentulose or hexulose) kinase